MKKNVYLGIDCTGKYCCILKTFLSFEQMVMNANDLEASDFLHEATNWCGKDDVERTLEIKKWKIKDHYFFNLPKPIVFKGYDEDIGNKYKWTFEVSAIAEMKGDGEA